LLIHYSEVRYTVHARLTGWLFSLQKALPRNFLPAWQFPAFFNSFAARSLIIARLKKFTYVLFSGSQAMDTICATLKDYFEDYQFLKPKNFKMVIEEAQVITGSLL
jgi:hypothetical protein